MSTRAAIIQSGLAAAGVALAAWAARPVSLLDEDRDEVIVDARPPPTLVVEDGVKSVRLDCSGLVAELSEASGAGRSQRRVRGGDMARELCEAFAPLRGRRLGVLEEGKRRELGLDVSTVRLSVSQGAAEHRFELTGAYLSRATDREVFIAPMAESAARALAGELSQLAELALHRAPVTRGDSLRVRLKTGESHAFEVASPSLDLKRRGAGPAAVDGRVTTWHQRLWGLRADWVYGEREPVGAEEPTVVLRLDYETRAGGALFCELATLGELVVARSELTLGWVRLPAEARQLLAEAEQLF